MIIREDFSNIAISWEGTGKGRIEVGKVELEKVEWCLPLQYCMETPYLIIQYSPNYSTFFFSS